MAIDLVERITNAPRLQYHGVGYRHQAPTYDPLSGDGARIHGGRFNPPDSYPVLYLCSTPGCAAAEFTRTSRRHPLGPSGFLPRALYRYETHLTTVLDLTDARTLAHLDVEPPNLVEEDLTLPRQIGEIAHQFGYQAVRNASATGIDNVVAVFIENLRGGVLTPSLHQTWAALDDLPVF